MTNAPRNPNPTMLNTFQVLIIRTDGVCLAPGWITVMGNMIEVETRDGLSVPNHWGYTLDFGEGVDVPAQLIATLRGEGWKVVTE